MDARTASSNYRKYRTGNPLVRWLIRRYMRHLVAIIRELRPTSIVDFGCGEGIVAQQIWKSFGPSVRYRGIDRSSLAVEEARRLNPHYSFQQADLFQLDDEPATVDLVLCLETLEHQTGPAQLVGKMARWARASAVVSVPWEPYFRTGSLLRGKYFTTLGNHPEHVQHFRPASLQALLIEYFPKVTTSTRFPWIFAVGRKR